MNFINHGVSLSFHGVTLFNQPKERNYIVITSLKSSMDRGRLCDSLVENGLFESFNIRF